MPRYKLFIDHEACWGCRTCEVACKQEMGAPPGVSLIAVREDGPRIVDQTPHFVYKVAVCRHCKSPPCLEVCPVDAIRRRGDGIVVLDPRKCVGCQGCLGACPYGAITFDLTRSVARKCNLCDHRVDQGLYPACADNVCLAHCIYFGTPEQIRTIRAAEKRRAAKGSTTRRPDKRQPRTGGGNSA